MEDIISEWDAELVKQSRSFTEHANTLAEWDRVILKNRQVLLDVEEHLCQVRGATKAFGLMRGVILLDAAAVIPAVLLSSSVTYLVIGPQCACTPLTFEHFALLCIDPFRASSFGKESWHARDAPTRDTRGTAVYGERGCSTVPGVCTLYSHEEAFSQVLLPSHLCCHHRWTVRSHRS